MNSALNGRIGSASARFGIHVSIAGGLDRIFERGESLGCGAVQLFSHSSRSWNFQVPEIQSLDSYRRIQRISSVSGIFVHASYLINIASEDPAILSRSRETLSKELLTADRLMSDGLVLHPGSAKKGDRTQAIERASDVVRKILDDLPTVRTPLLLENTAGAGSMLGATPEEMKQLFEMVDRPRRMGLCLDSCHLFASGVDLTSSREYETVLAEFLNASPSGSVALWHLNDALFARGSGRDRHAGLGEGTIGLAALSRIARDAVAAHVPVILETPKGEGESMDRINLRRLYAMAGCPMPDQLADAL